jgi:HAD superfamily hydrolase (TIGR01490 family)
MQNLALFDLDHTLLKVDSGYEWGRYMAKLGIVDSERFPQQMDQFHAEYKAGTLDVPRYLSTTMAPLAGHAREQLAAWHAQFMQEVILPAVAPDGLALVRQHKDKGDLCCMVTATNDFVTTPIAELFGVDMLIACQVETIDGQPGSAYTGRPTGTPSFREGKITRTEAWLASLGKSWSDFGRSYFYSDSHNDIPLLEKVTHPVAANPDATLRAHAQKSGWDIIDLFAVA